jgi:hypothetical protein
MTEPAALRRVLRTVALALGVVAASALPALALTGAKPVSPPASWTDGNALGRSSGYLQAVWASDCPPPSGRCATDRGPYMGVFWRRASIANPTGWGKVLRRLSQPHLQAARPALAADGNDVYVAWVTQGSYLHYHPGAPRIVWLRVSRNQGATWTAPVRLSTAGSRADYPVVAASGTHAWVVWTAAMSGQIRMAHTADVGAHWSTRTIGATTSGAGTPEGHRGYPAIGASGPAVMAAWFAGPGGKVLALVSDQHATEWNGSSVPTTLTPGSPNDGAHYPVVRGGAQGATNRVAVAYTTRSGIAARVYDGSGSSPGPALTVAGPWTGGSTYAGGYGASAIPFGSDGLAVVWSGCRRVASLPHACHANASKARIDLLERESANGGGTWSAVVKLGAASKGTPVNEAPSLEAGDGGFRSFMWLRRTTGWLSYRVWTRAVPAP